MAKITLGAQFFGDVTEFFAFPGENPTVIGKPTSKKISILDANGNTQSFTGSFKYYPDGSLNYDNSYLTGFTVLQGTSKVNLFSITGISIKFSDMLSHAQDGNDGIYALFDSFVGGDDIVTGSKYADTLGGGPGSNKIFGQAGDDILYSDIRSETVYDELTGGIGRDTFEIDFAIDHENGGIFTISDSGKVVIKDFKPSQGDKITFNFYDSSSSDIGLSYDGKVFSGEIGSVIFEPGKKFGQLLVDTDGNGSADVFVQVYGANKSFNQSWLSFNPSAPV